MWCSLFLNTNSTLDINSYSAKQASFDVIASEMMINDLRQFSWILRVVSELCECEEKEWTWMRRNYVTNKRNVLHHWMSIRVHDPVENVLNFYDQFFMSFYSFKYHSETSLLCLYSFIFLFHYHHHHKDDHQRNPWEMTSKMFLRIFFFSLLCKGINTYNFMDQEFSRSYLPSSSFLIFCVLSCLLRGI